LTATCQGGKRVRKYLPRYSLPFERDVLDRNNAIKKFASTLRKIFKHGRPGPAPVIPELQREILKTAGYRLAGGMRVTRDRRKFFGYEQIEFRHSLLDAVALAVARTPEALEKIEKKATSLQASYSRSRVKGMTYTKCLDAIFRAEAEKIHGRR